jgi:hypothetical protein
MTPWLTRGMWSIGLLGVARSVWTIGQAPVHEHGASAIGVPVLAPASQRPTSDSLIDAVAAMTAENLFRPDRSAVEEGVMSTNQPQSTMPVPTTPRPNLLLRGILGGPPWDAIIDGVPGREGAVVLRAGQTVNGLAVRSVGRDTVIIRGADTTWTLFLRH